MRDGKRPANAIRSTVLSAEKAGIDKATQSISGRYIRPRQRPTPRRYTDEEKAKVVAVAACITELGQKRTGLLLGVSQPTVAEWTKGINITQEALAMADEYKERIKAKFENILELALDVMPDKVGSASFWDLARATGLAFDKIQLMEGKPTVISGNELPSNERARMIFALMAQAKQRQEQAEVIDVTPMSPLEASSDAQPTDEWRTI